MKHLRTLFACASACAAAPLVGCAAQGSYTGELADEAMTRMDGIRADTELDFAQQAFEAQRLDRAEQRARAALAINPESAEARLMLARIAVERGRFHDAISDARRSIELDPANPDAHYLLGVALERLGALDEAHNAYTQALELDPGDAHAALAIAETLHMQGSPSLAEQALLDWEGHEYHAGAQQFLGQIAFARRDHELAIARLENARTIAPTDLGIIEDLAAVQIAAGRYAEAEANLAALRADPELAERPDLTRQHAECLARLGMHAEARDLYLGLAAAAPNPLQQARLWARVGELSYLAGDQPTLRRAASKAVETAPDRASGYVLWALFYMRDGQPARVRESIATGLKHASDPDDLRLLTKALDGIDTQTKEQSPPHAQGNAIAGAESDG